MGFRRDFATMQVALSHAWQHREYEERERRPLLRASSLPYCPLEEWARFVSDPEERPELKDGKLIELREYDLDSLLYTTIGTAVHEAIQNFLPRTTNKIKVLACWDPKLITATCKKDCPFKGPKGDPMELDSSGCSKCGQFPFHEEVVTFGASTGAIDQLWVIGMGKNVYLIDIKTTSMPKVYTHEGSLKPEPPAEKWVKTKGTKKKAPPKKIKSPFPQPPHLHQTDAYAVRVEPVLRSMGYKLKGTLILYVPRDRPSARILVPAHPEMTKQDRNAFRTVLDRVANGWKKMHKRLLADDMSEEAGLEMMKHKLCDDEDYYEKHVEPCWECPLSGVCFSKKALKREIHKLATVGREKPKSKMAKRDLSQPAAMRVFEGGISL